MVMCAISWNMTSERRERSGERATRTGRRGRERRRGRRGDEDECEREREGRASTRRTPRGERRRPRWRTRRARRDSARHQHLGCPGRDRSRQPPRTRAATTTATMMMSTTTSDERRAAATTMTTTSDERRPHLEVVLERQQHVRFRLAQADRDLERGVRVARGLAVAGDAEVLAVARAAAHLDQHLAPPATRLCGAPRGENRRERGWRRARWGLSLSFVCAARGAKGLPDPPRHVRT